MYVLKIWEFNSLLLQLRSVLEIKLDCFNSTEVKSLLNKIKLTNMVITLSKTFDDDDYPSDSVVQRHHRYQYWKENVLDSCTEGCSDLDYIGNAIIRFRPRYKTCHCS